MEACKSAVSGGGIFAFASATGVNLLMRDPVFATFAARGSFDLLVGLDAVTDVRALAALQAIMISEPNVHASVFLHARGNSLFHPKVAWFHRPGKGGTLITGSGNLTVGGLRANWEAFTVTKLSEAEAKTIEGQWNELVSRHTEKILAPDSTEALARAAKNNIRDARPRTRRKVPKRPEDVKQDDGTVQVVEAKTTDLIAPDSPVLVAELPRASDRWNQANFSLETYQGFFGAKIGAQHRILLQHVESDGHLAPLETRPSVEVRSRNFRFELQAAAHLPYPANGRPVAVFIRQLTGIFLYRLVLPSHTADYAAVSNLLQNEWHGPKRQVRRVPTSSLTLEKYWPDAPFWKVTTAPE